MPEAVEVLVMQSQPRAADDVALALAAAGHRVHRCHPDNSRGFPCRDVLTPGTCPIDQGIDVAVLVRPRVTPRPTPLEEGVSCVIRAGIPLIEDGPEILDPYAPWVARRLAADDVVAACTALVRRVTDPLNHRIGRNIAALLQTDEMGPTTVGCHVELEGGAVVVHLHAPLSCDRRLSQALAIRAFDAVRDSGWVKDGVDVHVHRTGPPAPSSSFSPAIPGSFA